MDVLRNAPGMIYQQNDSQGDKGQFLKKQPAGKVVQLVGLPVGITRAEVVRSLSCFGYVSCVNIPCDGVALVEFEELETAHKCIRYNGTASFPTLFNWPVKIYRMPVAKLARQYPATADHTSGLILTIEKLTTPLTVADIRIVFSSVGAVDSVAILQQGQDTLEAIVEFRDVASAMESKRLLNGCSMHPGCCVMYIDFVDVKGLFSSGGTAEGEDATRDAEHTVNEFKEVPERAHLPNQAGCPVYPFDSSNSGVGMFMPTPTYSCCMGTRDFAKPNVETGYLNGTGCQMASNSPSPNIVECQQFHQAGSWVQPFNGPNPFLLNDEGFHEPVVPLNNNGENLNMRGHLIIFGLKPNRSGRESLTSLLEGYGRIVNVQLQRDGRKFLACVETADQTTARRITEDLNGATVFGNRLRVRTDKKKTI